jgi:signal peptidase II
MSMALRRALAVALLVLLVDRALKIWIVQGLDLQSRFFIEVWDPYLNLAMAWNRGVNFGLFDFGDAGRWVLVALAIGISAALLWWARRARDWWIPLGAGLVVGGAIGNAWDRVQWGAVADFINMSCCGIRNPYAFNVADVAIFAGAGLLILFAERDGKRSPRRARRKKA